MVADIPYVSLEHTLKCVKLQVIDSIPYVSRFIPDNIKSPSQLYYLLSNNVEYKNDPVGVEFIQTLQTLIKNNGLGDCDCFTVASLTSLWYCDFKPLYVTIAGNTRFAPTHIYPEVYDVRYRKIKPFDLTNKRYGYERPYKFKQRLLFNLNNK